VSNLVQYDPLLVHYLAGELDALLRGRACASAPAFQSDLSLTLPVEGGAELRADLHPRRGWIRLLEDHPSDRVELDGICMGISAPPDERILIVSIRETGRFRERDRTLLLELPTNQWNALLLDENRRIVAALRARRSGQRSLHPGEEYVEPPSPPRYGRGRVSDVEAWTEWQRALAGVAGAERKRALVAGFAWTGSLNADWILESAEGEEGLGEAFGRWQWLCGHPSARPALVRVGSRVQPYPLHLRGRVVEPIGSLLGGMAAVADREPVEDADSAPGVDPALVALTRRRIDALERKISRLEAELGRSGEADRIRSWGDLLLARLHEVPRGAPLVALEGWEGESVEIPLDPSLSPAENAARHYGVAGRKKRAEEEVPRLIAAARAELARWSDAARELEQGRVPAITARAAETARRSAPAQRTRDLPAAPYRVFRTSGGLEVRVGRGARENDRLTFRESAPNDVWLHARSVAGSHVILRWPDPEGAPPARDLAEAAQLAALFSKARTSGTVAVDWTRRKHVRKPRGAPPGLVIPQRVKTLFVEPDEGIIGRLGE
jgi:hypothetical protein